MNSPPEGRCRGSLGRTIAENTRIRHALHIMQCKAAVFHLTEKTVLSWLSAARMNLSRKPVCRSNANVAYAALRGRSRFSSHWPQRMACHESHKQLIFLAWCCNGLGLQLPQYVSMRQTSSCILYQIHITTAVHNPLWSV